LNSPRQTAELTRRWQQRFAIVVKEWQIIFLMLKVVSRFWLVSVLETVARLVGGNASQLSDRSV
jgi:hypothetical protein